MRTKAPNTDVFVKLSLLPWLIWLGMNAIQARRTKRDFARAGQVRAVQEPAGARQLHLAALVGAVTLMVPALPAGPLDRRLLPQQPRWASLGLAIEVLGLGLGFWARVALGRFWTGRVAFSDDQPLIRRGPYRHVRHPLYAGLLLGALGTALALGRARGLAALLLLGSAYARKTAYEEFALRQHFGDEYDRYAATVPGYLPRLGR